jgi:hypothetical protein
MKERTNMRGITRSLSFFDALACTEAECSEGELEVRISLSVRTSPPSEEGEFIGERGIVVVAAIFLRRAAAQRGDIGVGW